MEQKPRRRYGILIFSLVFLAVAGAISATVLLANNRRNLDHVMRSLGFQVTETMVIPKPGVMEKFKGKRLKDIGVMLDPYVLMPEIKGRDGAFLRSMKKNGETFCELFDRLGYKMSKWQPGTFSKKINECWYEETIANPEKPNDPSSFFLMIKGEDDGTLVSTRVKFIFTDASARTKLSDMAIKVLDEYAKATNWLEIADEGDKIRALMPFTTSLGGFSARFASEFSGTGRYNLIFSRPLKLSPAEKRTEAFFDPTKFFPLLPEYGGPKIPDAAPAKT